jgi:hypothetical protein
VRRAADLTGAGIVEANSCSRGCGAMPPRRITAVLGDRINARQHFRMRVTPARLDSALRLAKQSLEETNRHLWTQEDQDLYISTLFDHIKRDVRWSCVEDVAVYICAMFRLAENNMDYMGLYGQTAYSL